MTKEDLCLIQQKVTDLRAEGKYKETIENCYLLLDVGLKLKDYKSILTAYVNLAASYYCLGDVEEALSSILLHEDICQGYGDDSDLLNTYNILFLLYEYNKNIDKAKETLEKSLALGLKLEKYNIVSNAYSNYSHICIVEEEFCEALSLASKGLQYAKKHKPVSVILEIRVNLNLAKAYIGLKDLNNAKRVIDAIINNPVLENFVREKAQCYDLLGHWYNESKLYMESFEAFTCAKIIVESYEDLYLLKAIQQERCKLCELMGHIELGYNVQKEYINLLDEISKKELELTGLKLEIKRSVASIERKANYDYLSGVYNRSYIEKTSNNWLKYAKDKKESIVCIVFDIDKFKETNDNYGHLFGDEVIKQVSKVCSKIIREDDLIGRFGGDEFVIILKGASLEEGRKKAEQILNAVGDLEIRKDADIVRVTLSIGVTDNISCRALIFDELFNSADILLYRAKNNGRNQVCSV
jgi:diguanylate cyclase (GGDEF)-like protein